jgi:glucose/arabinose dehydrogenase
MKTNSNNIIAGACAAVFLGLLNACATDVNLPVAADTFIISGSPNNNAGGHAWFDAGADGPFGGNAVRRGLVRFDLSAIPPGATATSAVVQLTVVRASAAGAVDSSFDLYRLLAGWGEGNKVGNAGALATNNEATWISRLQGTSDWTAAGAMNDVAATASASTAVGATSPTTYSWSSAALVSDVQAWLNNPAQNFGWLLVSEAEVTSRSVRGFASRESGVNVGTLQVGFTAQAATPPTVSITSPTNGATFLSGTPLTLLATASETGGTVTQVEFFDGATSLGVSTTGPDYSVTTTLYTGAHVLTAVATDNLGTNATSAPVTITGSSVPIADPIPARIPKGNITIELQTLADGLAAPIGMTVPDDNSGRMFVYDQEGRGWVVTSSGPLPTPLVDLRSRLVALGVYDERGFLGLAAHPDFANHPLLYTFTSEPYSAPADFQNGLGISNNCQSVIAEWHLTAGNSNVIDLASRREILRVDKPQFNHNGGAMHFGPDGMLYVVLGDGGNANDVGAGHIPGGNAQDLNRIWGKMIRINVDGTNSANGQYGIPSDNPFVGTNALGEIWAYGLRNPFSFGFERGTGTLFLADVGQNKVEEVDIITKGGNYGWNVKEGTFYFDSATGNPVTTPARPVPPNLTDPIAEYDHDEGLAIMCGFVYHGSAIPGLQGRFVFGDWGSFSAPSGRLFYLDATNGVNEMRIGMEDRPLGLWIRGYGQGPDGELYLFCSRQLGPTGNTGRMLKLVPMPDPMQITGITPNGATAVAASWTGGAGPFALQRRAAVNDPTWVNASFTTLRSAPTPSVGRAGFFRTFDAAHEAPIPLTVYMTGGGERPANSSPALGTGIFRLDGNTLTFNLRYSGLTAVATAAHIHGPTNTFGSTGVIIPLNAFNGGAWNTNGTLSGVVVVTDAQRAMILGCQTYVNIHNANFPNGEIRGQLAPVNFQIALSSANEVPPSGTGAGGLGNLALVGNQLTFNLTYRGLSGIATASHIHGPTNTTGNAGVLINLGAFNGGAYGSNGTLSGTVSLTPDQLGWVIDGLTYINFHTAGFPAGETRGQILPQSTGIPLTALLSGLAEHPAQNNTAAGAGTFSLEGDRLTFNVVYSGLSGPATASHIHGYTNTTADAAVLINLAPFNGGAYGASGALSGSMRVTPAQRIGLLSGLTYVNFHTTAQPGGEMRGQIAPATMSAALSGVNEGFVPAVTPGAGSATFVLVRDQLSLNVTYGGLLSTATASHIHGPAGLFQSAGVIVPFDPYNGGAYGTAGSLVGTAPLGITNLLNLIDGSTYVNFHTTNYPGGEIRGQIIR